MGLRWIPVAALAAALAPIYGASASQTTPDGALGELRSRIEKAQAPSTLASASQARRARISFRISSGTVQPLDAGFGGAGCRRGQRNAVSGFMLVRSETTGQMHMSDFFPSLNPAGTAARRWLVGVRNTTGEPQRWFGGTVCTATPVRYRVFDSRVGPFESDAGVITCPRSAPNAISGFFLVGSETTGELQLGDFLPELRGRARNARARGWAIGVKNLTDRRLDWLGGAVCTRATVRFAIGSGEVGPLATLVGRSRCPAVAPNAVSGFSLVADQPPGDYATGQLQVSDFFPIVRGGRRPVARQWAVGVRNLTDQPQRWIWGSMCLGADRGAARPSAARAAQPRLGGIRRQAQAGRRARIRELCKKPLWKRLHQQLCRRYGY